MKTLLAALLLSLVICQLAAARSLTQAEEKPEEMVVETGDSGSVTKPRPQAWDEFKSKVVEDLSQWMNSSEAVVVGEDQEEQETGWFAWVKNKLADLVPESVKEAKKTVEEWMDMGASKEDVENYVNDLLDEFFGYIDKMMSYVDGEETTEAPTDPAVPWLVNGTFSEEKQRLWYGYLYKKWKHYFKKSHRMPYN